MKKTLLLLSVFAIVAGLSTSSAFAGDFLNPSFPKITSGTYDRNMLWVRDDTEASVQMPRAIKTESQTNALASAMFTTPSGSSPMTNFQPDGQLALSGISALNARGSTMMTPKQRADREIRKLVRQLD